MLIQSLIIGIHLKVKTDIKVGQSSSLKLKFKLNYKDWDFLSRLIDSFVLIDKKLWI